jgi:hypothetical protein
MATLRLKTYAEAIVARYPVGQMVTVYYTPDDPAKAVLEPGLSLKAFFTLSLGLVFLGVGGGLGYLFYATRPKLAQSPNFLPDNLVQEL